MLLRLTALLGLVFLSACATITTSPSQDLTVLTEPAGAACQMERGGQPVAQLAQTPGTVRIGKSTRETTVSCTKEGHLPAQAVLSPEFQPVVLGNILIGGIVGLVVDASTGAIAKYPDTVQLTLVSAGFASPEARAAYFGDRAATIRREADERVAQMRRNCGSSGCESQVSDATANRDRSLAQLEDLRQKTP
ncbi:hypothetical protein [Roseomonas indoligenes]|uniref:Lipoprotein n=1 Tax=Roseomonas indoligenes TaxID=2820811 RepID=A0A940S6N6_9PROT|nr:hypothetical protein [Pararoseomonas indoligenes]MBP0494125.1 hypothetical protein [Pararoseomonas indoligenes]